MSLQHNFENEERPGALQHILALYVAHLETFAELFLQSRHRV